jgi:hypothetical protein
MVVWLFAVNSPAALVRGTAPRNRTDTGPRLENDHVLRRHDRGPPDLWEVGEKTTALSAAQPRKNRMRNSS